MNLEAAVIAALIAAVAAMTTAVVTVLNTRRTINSSILNVEKTIAASTDATEKTIRANVVSTNRQRWIDAIRDDFAKFLSSHDVALAYQHSDGCNPKMAEDAQVARREMYHLASRIRLRLNPEEAPHQEFLELVEELRRMETPWEQAEERAVRAAQAIFKAEWVRIRRGE